MVIPSNREKLRIEAPVNGGRNYEQDTALEERPRERNCSSVNKLGYMLEHPVRIRRYSLQHEAVTMRPVRTISRKDNSASKNREHSSGNRLLPSGFHGW